MIELYNLFKIIAILICEKIMKFSPDIISLIRGIYGIALSEVSILCNMNSKGTIGNYETGIIKPSVESFETLANVFAVSFDFLNGRTLIPYSRESITAAEAVFVQNFINKYGESFFTKIFPDAGDRGVYSSRILSQYRIPVAYNAVDVWHIHPKDSDLFSWPVRANIITLMQFPLNNIGGNWEDYLLPLSEPMLIERVKRTFPMNLLGNKARPSAAKKFMARREVLQALIYPSWDKDGKYIPNKIPAYDLENAVKRLKEKKLQEIK